MKRTSLIILGVFVALLATYLVLQTRKAEIIEHRLEIPPIRVDDNRRDDEAEGAVGPPTRIRVEREGQELLLVRTPAGEWDIADGTAAVAHGYKVKSMLRAFADETTSSLGREVPEEELIHYGFGENRGIHVTMYLGEEQLLDLVIGDAVKADEQGTVDTNVMTPDSNVVFRLRGRDLRGPFDVDPDSLRTKKVFRFKKDEIRRIKVTDPRGEVPQTLVIEASGEGEAREWVLMSPEGYSIGGVDTWCSALANLSATRYEATLPGAEGAALDKTYRLEVTHGGEGGERTEILELGAGRGAVWARLQGREGVFQVSTSSATSLMKSLSDLRDKKLFSMKKEEISAFEFQSSGETFGAQRQGDAWAFTGDGGSVSSAAANRLAATLSSLRTQDFVTRPIQGTGLDRPSYSIKVIKGDGGSSHLLELGDPVAGEDAQESKRTWARLDSRKELLQLAEYSVKAIRKTRSELEDKRIFQVEEADIIGLEIAYPDEQITLARGPKGWVVTAPEQLSEPVGVDGIIRTLADLPLKSEAAMADPADARLSVTFTLNLADGSRRILKLSEEVLDGGNYAQVQEHPRRGTGIFTVSQYKASNLLKKLVDLKKAP